MPKALNIPPDIVKRILNLRSEGKTYTEIVGEVGYSTNTIRSIVLRNTTLRPIDYYVPQSANPNYEQMVVDIEAGVKQEFQALTKREGLSMRTVILKLIQNWIEENK